MALPANVSFGKVIGTFLLAMGDTLDPDTDPDAVVATGQIKFTPGVPYILNISAVPPVTIVPTTVACTLGSSGQIQDPTGADGVWLIATDDPDLNPSDWTYGVEVSLDGLATRFFSLAVPADTTVDLSVAQPVASSTGNAITRGDPGLIVLGPLDPVPALTPVGTVILRTV